MCRICRTRFYFIHASIYIVEYCIYFQRKHEEQDSDSVCTDFLNDAVSFH